MSETVKQDGGTPVDDDLGFGPYLTTEINAIIAVERELRTGQAVQLRQVADYAAASAAGQLCADGTPRRYHKYAPEELALALDMTVAAASNLLELAVTTTQRLPATLAMMEAGELDLRRVQMLADVTRPLPDDVTRQVEDYVLARAEGRNASEVRRVATRAVHRFDPDGVEQRHRARKKERRVELWPLDDGMAELRAYLTAPDATLIKLRLDAFARAMPAEDERTMDQRRADVLRDLLLDRAAGPVKTVVHVTVPATVLADTSAAQAEHEPSTDNTTTGQRTAEQQSVGERPPAMLAGYGTITAGQARELATGDGATWHRLLTDPVSGIVLDYGRTTYVPPAGLADFVRARDPHCIFPGCSVPSPRCDLDHRVPWPKGPTSADNLAPLCRRHHQLKHDGEWRVRKRPDGYYVWTSPAEIEYLNRPGPITESGPWAEPRTTTDHRPGRT
jgi:hypothetical protein